MLALACAILWGGIIIYRYGCWRYFAGRLALRKWHSTDARAGGGPAEQCLRVTRAGVALVTPIHALQAGDIVFVQSGELIPADGIITAGAAWVAAQPLGSERQVKKVHQRVCANHLVLAGSIVVQVEPQVGQDDALA